MHVNSEWFKCMSYFIWKNNNFERLANTGIIAYVGTMHLHGSQWVTWPHGHACTHTISRIQTWDQRSCFSNRKWWNEMITGACMDHLKIIRALLTGVGTYKPCTWSQFAKPDMYQQNTYILGTTCTAISDHRSMQHAHNVMHAQITLIHSHACFSRRK